ncbi:MAG: hypothetical protein ACTSYL_05545 [Candidatus Thorarchaeota archaeon]
MSDESRYRTESPLEDEDEERAKAFTRPLPREEKVIRRQGVPMVRFLIWTMPEDRRDRIIMLLMPLLTAVTDTAIFAAIVIDALPDTAVYMFYIPIVLAIPIGMTVPQLKHTLISSILASIFFIILLILFLAVPGMLVPEVGIGEFVVTGAFVAAVYFFFVLFASMLGSFVGILLREFM